MYLGPILCLVTDFKETAALPKTVIKSYSNVSLVSSRKYQRKTFSRHRKALCKPLYISHSQILLSAKWWLQKNLCSSSAPPKTPKTQPPRSLPPQAPSFRGCPSSYFLTHQPLENRSYLLFWKFLLSFSRMQDPGVRVNKILHLAVHVVLFFLKKPFFQFMYHLF